MEVNSKGRIIYLEKTNFEPEVIFYNKCWEYHKLLEKYNSSKAFLESNKKINEKFLNCK